MIGLLVSILFFWIIWRMLRRHLSEPIEIEAPAPVQVVIHIHSARVLVQAAPERTATASPYQRNEFEHYPDRGRA